MRKFFIIVFVWIGTFSLASGQADSLGIEKQEGKVFVLHKVKAKQTLYSLARRYKTSITAINKANPVLTNGLQTGQTLRIPFGGKLPVADKHHATTSTTQTVTHKVQAGETLFAISRKYQVSITDLKTWNKLSSNALAMGQTLKINLKKEAKAEATNPLKDNKIAGSPPTEPAEVPPTTEQQGETDTTAKEKSSEPMAYQGAPFKSYEIDGLAEVIQEEDPSDKFLALHRTAKTGTVIKVKNLMNNLTVYVKVVGIIADTSANDNVIIKLNKKAYEHLKAVDKRFQVQLSYFQ